MLAYKMFTSKSGGYQQALAASLHGHNNCTCMYMTNAC